MCRNGTRPLPRPRGANRRRMAYLPGNRRASPRSRLSPEIPDVRDFRRKHRAPAARIRAVRPVGAGDGACAHVDQLDEVVAPRIGEPDFRNLGSGQLAPEIARQRIAERAVAAAFSSRNFNGFPAEGPARPWLWRRWRGRRLRRSACCDPRYTRRSLRDRVPRRRRKGPALKAGSRAFRRSRRRRRRRCASVRREDPQGRTGCA